MANKTMRRVVPTRVNFLENKKDLLVLTLGGLGFTTEFIRQRTGLSHCQVLYRLGKMSIRRKDYRCGESYAAQFVLKGAEKQVGEQMRRLVIQEL